LILVPAIAFDIHRRIAKWRAKRAAAPDKLAPPPPDNLVKDAPDNPV
jgi:hypothetical protein